MLKFQLLLIVVLFGLLLGCGRISESEKGSCSIANNGFLVTENCQLLRWQVEDLPVRISIEDGTPSDITEAIFMAAAIWEHQTGLELFEIETTTVQKQSTINHDINLIALRAGSEWTLEPIEGREDEPAKTVYYFSNFGLYNANIFFNEDFYGNDDYDINTIALHELGHVLGLDHDDSEVQGFSIMNSRILPGVERELSIRDLDRIKSLYEYNL